MEDFLTGTDNRLMVPLIWAKEKTKQLIKKPFILIRNGFLLYIGIPTRF